jgi:hypothetical protein
MSPWQRIPSDDGPARQGTSRKQNEPVTRDRLAEI